MISNWRIRRAVQRASRRAATDAGRPPTLELPPETWGPPRRLMAGGVISTDGQHTTRSVIDGYFRDRDDDPVVVITSAAPPDPGRAPTPPDAAVEFAPQLQFLLRGSERSRDLGPADAVRTTVEINRATYPALRVSWAAVPEIELLRIDWQERHVTIAAWNIRLTDDFLASLRQATSTDNPPPTL